MPPSPAERPETDRLRQLLHRWFVEYNPLYLLSAMLVLGGTLLFSRGLVHEESVVGLLGVAAIAEIYSLALVGGAALLMRLGHRRSAVMLGLLTAVYQCDLTLHTETSANLGSIGVAASAAWLGLFVAKLYAAARIFDLRLSRAAWSAALLGAAGLAAMPYALPSLDGRAQTAVVAFWIFAVVSLQRFATITPTIERDAWGVIVERRALRATWLAWAGIGFLHVAFWSLHHRFPLAALLPALPLFAMRFVKRETRAYALAATTLGLTAFRTPESFAWVAGLAALAFAVRAWDTRKHPSAVVTLGVGAAPTGPYRMVEGAAELAAATPQWTFIDPTPVVQRLMVASGLSLYVALWTWSWTGGAWPAHVFVLDVVFTGLAIVAAVWRGARVRVTALPVVATWGHAAIAANLVPMPHGALGWGGTAIGLGFVLLFGSLGASYALRAKPEITTKSG